MIGRSAGKHQRPRPDPRVIRFAAAEGVTRTRTPMSSFFFVSTLRTGSPAACRQRLARSLGAGRQRALQTDDARAFRASHQRQSQRAARGAAPRGVTEHHRAKSVQADGFTNVEKRRDIQKNRRFRSEPRNRQDGRYWTRTNDLHDVNVVKILDTSNSPGNSLLSEIPFSSRRH